LGPHHLCELITLRGLRPPELGVHATLREFRPPERDQLAPAREGGPAGQARWGKNSAISRAADSAESEPCTRFSVTTSP